MFCDLVGATALSERFDPEDLRELLRDYQAVCAAAIGRFDGHIVQYLGDGLLVYFGYPRAHEDDAQRAVRAGLVIVEDMARLTQRLERERGVTLAVRLGIHTGLVIAGEMGAGGWRETLAVGETPNVAARLQSVADPNTVVISRATYRLTEGFFGCQRLGTHALKGISQPMELYRVLHETGARGRLDVAPSAGLTSLVGREHEIGLLREWWTEAGAGPGRVVLLSGEAGIGKSRLLQVLKEHVADIPHTWLELRCSPYYQNSTLYPVIDALQRRFRFRREDAPADRLRHLEEGLAPYGVALPETVPLFAALLSVPLAAPYAPLALSPQRQRQKTLEALLALVQAMAIQQPVLFLIEDLHWADPSTLELLTHLIDQAPPPGLLTLLTFRPDFTPPWAARPHLAHLTLTRFARPEVETMAQRVAGGKALPADVLRQIVLKTDGVPLFVEELTKMLLESGALRPTNGRYELSSPVSALAIPATLQDSLMARLDRLSSVKEVAQLGATIGREFPYELLHAVSPLDEPTLQGALARLVEAELVSLRGTPPHARYVFKHALIQDAAYQSLLKSRRRQYHPQIARALEQRFPETVETQPELLAHHYTEAGLKEQAIPYWQRAGQRAVERSANLEAIAHLTKGLELLETLPDTPGRAQQELTLQVTLGAPLIATKGYSAAEVGAVYSRARELCRQVGETPHLFPVMWGLWVFYIVGVNLETAHELAMQCLGLAQTAEDHGFRLEAHGALAVTAFYRGELASAKDHAEQSLALYDPPQHGAHAFVYGQDPGVVALGYAARTLPLLGYVNRAIQRAEALLAMARKLSHQHSVGAALMHVIVSYLLQREVQRAREQADALITVATEHDLLFWLGMARMLRGAALVEEAIGSGERASVEAAVAQLRDGLAGYRALGAGLDVPACVVALARGYLELGQAREGLDVLAGALTDVDRTGQRYYEAEMYRIQGELRLALSEEYWRAAEDTFQRAVEVARHQGARLLELRATLSLARLLQRQDRTREAREQLTEIYSWFTEGFDARDLREARALLDEVSRP
jgi:predicted ATPase/class 3 adenylate cyclase